MNADVHTILAATDLSRPAFAAVRRAALIARAHHAKLELVHVIPDLFHSDVWMQLSTCAQAEIDVRNSIAESLAALVAQIEAETGVKANALVAEGKPFAEIAARSEAIDAGLIVVGAHGENLLLTPLLGTTAHRVLRFARKPVLLVKQTPSLEHAATTGYGQIVAATDFSKDALCAATSAQRLFPQTTITLFHAYQAPFEAKLSGRISDEAFESHRQHAFEQAHRQLESFAAAAHLIDAPRVVRHGSPGIRLREYAAKTSADLIAIGSEEVSRVQNALLGSVSLDIVTQADCDVLLARSLPG